MAEPENVTVLNEIDLTVGPGQTVSFTGPSGSGKTTLLNLIAGIDRPTSGTVTVLGADVSSMAEDDLAAWRNRHLGFVFQQFNLIPVLTAFENVELPLLLTRLNAAQRRRNATIALKLVGLEGRMSHKPGELSGGQQQRVAIARALITDPTLISADEPTGDLDRDSAGEILDLLGRLNGEFGKTIILVTHDPEAASRAPRLIRLIKGNLMTDERNNKSASNSPGDGLVST